MSCFDNIISINGDCGSPAGESLSGLDLFDAPEINKKSLAFIANEEYMSGLELATAKVDLAKKLIKNDVMAALTMNNAIPNLTDVRYTTSTFKTGTTYAAEAKERGVTLYRNQRIRGKLRKTVIHTVKIYPTNNATDVTLTIYDDFAGGLETTYTIDLIANEVNEFDVSYTIQGTFARVLLDGTNVGVASSYLTCFTGCNGSMPNDCGYTKGWYDDREISAKEGYGISLIFSCKCDYSEFLCDLSREFFGELVWLKSRVLLMEEHIRTTRLNNWIIYGREEAKEYLTDIENEYRSKWNVFAQSLPNILKQFMDDCLVCRGVGWRTNI